MAYTGVSTIQLPGVPANPANPAPWRDPILKGVANAGVRFMADAAFPWSYPGGAPATRPAAGAPSNGAAIQDMSGNANGSVAVAAGALAYSGGGFDFTNSQGIAGGAQDSGIIIPAAALADIATAYGGKVQRYLFSVWVKLPTLANWNAAGGPLAIVGDKTYQSFPSLFMIGQVSGGSLQVRRQTAANAYDTTTGNALSPAAGDYGSVVQIGLWRNDAGQGFRLRSANGTVLQQRALGSDNTQDFSTNTMTVGRAGTVFAGASSTTTLAALSGFRVYRTFLENLARSGRDPATVLDADFAAVTARNAFS